MTEPKKLSRRDALKILGAAAGASVLANIPGKWTKPELATGVLPAHAQTSTCFAVVVEVISNNGTLNFYLAQGPNPNQPFTGTAGSTVDWNCQSGCLEFGLGLGFPVAPGTTASVQITTYNHSPFTLDFSSTNTFHEVLIDMATGNYALNFTGTPPGNCSWQGG